MTAIEFDMFENTGHEDMVFGFTSIEEAIDNMDACEETIPEFFDDSILKKEEPIPFQNKICLTKESVSPQKARPETDSITESSVCTLNYIRTLTSDSFPSLDNLPIKDRPAMMSCKEEKVQDMDLFYCGKDRRTISVPRRCFKNRTFKPEWQDRVLRIKLTDMIGYQRLSQQAQAVLDDINELRVKGNMKPWTLTDLLTAEIESVDDFLYFSFKSSAKKDHWDTHDIEGAETQYDFDKETNTYTFFYIPWDEGNDFELDVKAILDEVKQLKVIDWAKKHYRLPKMLKFTTKVLDRSVSSEYRKLSYEFDSTYLYITFPWVKGLKFMAVNYDKKFKQV